MELSGRGERGGEDDEELVVGVGGVEVNIGSVQWGREEEEESTGLFLKEGRGRFFSTFNLDFFFLIFSFFF